MLKINMKFGDNELAMMKDMAVAGAEMLEAAGAMGVGRTSQPNPVPGWGIHEVGIARMGDDPKTSVLTPFCQTHDVKNLFVMDGSASSRSRCQNPTLTIMALTVRSTDHLARGNEERQRLTFCRTGSDTLPPVHPGYPGRSVYPGYPGWRWLVSKHDDAYEISRRDFATRLGGVAAAAMVAGRDLAAAPLADTKTVTPARVIGANDRVVLASIGVRGQGNSLKRGFAQAEERRDQDALRHRRQPRRRAHQRPTLDDVADVQADFVQDLRRVLDDKDIDGVIIATPNHWHALATIWALQAGKHVYVEKPASHTVWEGRQDGRGRAKRYNKIVQVGTMNRSRPAVQQAIEFIKDGGIGKVYMARGLCFKPRPGIGKYPDGPMAAGEQYKLNVEVEDDRAGVRRGLPVEGRLRPLARPGAEAAVQPQPLPLQLALALGLRQRRHRQPGPAPVRHRALGPRQERAPGAHRLERRLLRPALVAGDARHPHVVVRVRRRDGPRVRARAARTPTTKARRRSAICSTEPRVGLDRRRRREVAGLSRRQGRQGRGRGLLPRRAGGGSDPNVLTSIEFPHYQNFVDALRANDPKILTCDILEGHLSSTLPHLANIAYLTGAPSSSTASRNGSGTTRTPTSC